METALQKSGGMSRSKYATIVFLVICLAYLFVTFHRVCPNIIAVDLSNELKMDAVTLGLMSSIFFFTFGLMQLPSGIMADSLGPRKTVPGFFALAGIASILFGLTDSVSVMLICRAVMGVGVSVIFVCGVKLLSNWFPPDKFASMNGLYLGMGGIGLILGSGPLAYLCKACGWRMSMVVTGVVTVVIAVLLFLFIFDKPEDKGYEPYQRTEPTKKGEAVRVMKENVLRIVSSAQFWFIAVWFCCHFSIHMSFGGVWGGPFLMDVHGLTRVEAGNILNMMGIGMLIGGPINGYLSDSVFHGRRPVMLLNSALMFATFCILSFWGDKLPVWGLYLWFFCIAVFGMGALCAGFASMKDIFGAGATGASSGLLNAFPSFAVAIIQPLTGAILEYIGRGEHGFTAHAFSIAAVLYIGLAAIGFIAAFIAKEPMKK